MSTIDDDFVVSRILRHYHRGDLRQITDYDKVVANGEVITENGTTLHKYRCPMMTIYLTDDGYPVDIDRQRVDIEKNAYYYKFTDDEEIPDDIAYEYVNPYEWKRFHPIPHPDEEEE